MRSSVSIPYRFNERLWFKGQNHRILGVSIPYRFNERAQADTVLDAELSFQFLIGSMKGLHFSAACCCAFQSFQFLIGSMKGSGKTMSALLIA